MARISRYIERPAGATRDREPAGPPLLAACRAYSTAAVVLHQRIAERLGLSAADVKALDVLQRRGPLTAGELARETALATASVTSLIDRLERKHLVRRVPDPTDRRKVRVELGRAMFEQVVPLFTVLEGRMRARIGRCSARQAAIIEAFLLGAVDDLRAAIAELAVPEDPVKRNRTGRPRVVGR